jgi:hypothetical protein
MSRMMRIHGRNGSGHIREAWYGFKLLKCQPWEQRAILECKLLNKSEHRTVHQDLTQAWVLLGGIG